MAVLDPYGHTALRHTRLSPPLRIKESPRQRHVRLDLRVLLEPARVAVGQELDPRRDPGRPDRLIVLEADVARLRRVAPGLQQPYEHEPSLVQPELPRAQVACPGTDDIDRTPVPAVLMH